MQDNHRQRGLREWLDRIKTWLWLGLALALALMVCYSVVATGRSETAKPQVQVLEDW